MKTIIFEGRLIVLNYVKEIEIHEIKNLVFTHFKLSIKYFDNSETIHINKIACDDFIKYYQNNPDGSILKKFREDMNLLRSNYRELYNKRFEDTEIDKKLKEIEENYFREKGYDFDITVDKVRKNLETKLLFLQNLLNDLPNPIIIR